MKDMMKEIVFWMKSMSWYFEYCVFVCVLTWLTVVGAAASAKMNGMNDLNNITDSDWRRLSHISFYFGHQSVGDNILSGIGLIKQDNPDIHLVIRDGHSPAEPGVLLQSKIGNNGDPVSKIKAFKQVMDNGLGNKVDVALFKFCYIDFTVHTSPELVFNAYKNVMDELQKIYPKTVFLHATVPLVAIEHGPKAWVKKIIGRTLDGTKDNAKRHEFNEMLRAEYKGKEPIFDIAGYESTRPDGTRETFELDGKRYYALVPAYTSDGGHLNALGSRYLASELLLVLVDASVK